MCNTERVVCLRTPLSRTAALRLALTKTKVNGRRYYCVTTPKLGGGRKRRFFKEKAEAETFMQLARRLQAFVRRSAEEVVLLLEAFCARIETKHEIRKWNRALERDT